MGVSIARIGGRSGYRQQCSHVSPVMWTDDLTSRAPFGPNSTYAEVGIALMQSPALRQAGEPGPGCGDLLCQFRLTNQRVSV